MRTIIVALDGSPLAERAIEPACAFAERAGANLILVTSTAAHPQTGQARAYLEGQVAAIQERGGRLPTIETEVVSDGSPADAICRVGRETPDSVICMSTHGRSGLGSAMLGSVAEAVVRDATSPVLLVGPHNEVGGHLGAPAHVVVCVDESDRSRTIVGPAVQVALDLHADITAVRVLEPILALVPSRYAGPGPEATTADLDGSRPAPEPELAGLEAVAKEIANRGVPASYALLRPDNAADAITRFADDTAGTACIALATHGRSGIARVVLGSVAQRVVHRARCPVLVRRPPATPD